MAKTKLNLHAYQESILERISDLKRKKSTGATSRLGVKSGDNYYLAHLEDVSEVVAVPELKKIPLTQDWALGLSNVRGNLYMVSDLAGFSGQFVASISSESRVLLVNSFYETNAALLIDKLVGLRDVEAMIAVKSDAQKKNQFEWVGKSFKDVTGIVWQELNIGLLLKDNAFAHVALK